MKVLLFTLFFLSVSITSSRLLAQDSLAHYSLIELNTLYKEAKKPQEKLLYALGMLEKTEKKFGTQDTAYATVLSRIGGAYLQTRNLSEAFSYLEKAIEIQKVKAAKSEKYAQNLSNLGVVYYYQGELTKVEKLWGDVLTLRKEILGEKHPNYVKSLSNLGTLYSNMGDYKKAEEYYLQALKIQKEIFGEKDAKYARGLNNLGTLHNSMGNYRKAEGYYLQALTIQKEVLGEKNYEYAGSINNLGVVYWFLNDYAKAEAFYLQALKLREELFGKKHPYYIKSLNNLGGLYHRTKDYSNSEQYYLRALNISKEISGDNHPEYTNILNNLGGLYSEMKKYANSEEYYLMALEIYRRVHGERHPNCAEVLNNLGRLYKDLKHYEKAEAHQLQALSIRKEILGERHLQYIGNLFNLGDTYYSMNEKKQAWKAVLQAISSNSDLHLSPKFTASTIDSLATANYTSFDYMNKSLILLYKLLAKENHSAQIQEQQNLICDLALKLLERSKNERTDEQDKLRILTDRAYWVLRFIELPNIEKNPEQALNIIEQNKSVLILDDASNKRAYISGLLPSSLIEEEKKLQKQYASIKGALAERRPPLELDSLRSKLTELNIEIDNFKKEIKKNYPKYASMKFKHDAISTSEIQARLNEKTALLEYLIGDSLIYIFYVDKHQVKVNKLPINNKAFQARIKSLHQTLSNYKLLLKDKKLAYRKYTGEAYWFYKNLVAPVLVDAKGIENLLIVTDGELGHLPFEVFLVEDVNQKVMKYSELHYLIDDYNISYSYSASLWNENKRFEKRKNNSQVLGIAANYAIALDSSKLNWRLPVNKQLRKSLNPLLAARKEVETLQENFKGFFAFDRMASEKKFKEKATNFGIIHLAMHGILNKKEQVLSSLVFTEVSDSGENNFLCAYEISKMELNADLVVLSACETGYGKFERGNGIASLARSFMYAGVPSMIVSLWQVNDHSTSLIMKNLYSNLAEGMPKDEALRQAKRTYLRSTEGIFAHPAFWSPFIVMGNTESISIAKKGTLFPWTIGGGILLLTLGAFALSKWRKK